MQARRAQRATRPWSGCRNGRAGKSSSERAHLVASIGARACLLETVDSRVRWSTLEGLEEVGRFDARAQPMRYPTDFAAASMRARAITDDGLAPPPCHH